MRASRTFLATLKEAPADAELISHKLMIRAGLIRRLAGGIYTWMPLGLRVVRKIEAIVREEMNRAGAIELFMPAVQPAELWQESGRWLKYGPELLRFKDRHERDFCVGPTHEEVITDIARREIRSYRQLPVHFYQIQTKFRDEIRPRFGVMRGREFIMKDGYSFHADFADLQREYRNMYDTYSRIFTRLGLKFRAVAADTGAIGGTGSHEFHVLAESGEDAIAYCPQSDYAANVELAEAVAPAGSRKPASDAMKKVPTPGATRCHDVARLLGLPLEKTVKAIAIIRKEIPLQIRPGLNSTFALVLLRGDHDLNEVKLQRIVGEFRFAREDEIEQYLNCPPGYIGPVGVPESVHLVADHSVAQMADFVCGANVEGFHLTGVNWVRDLPNAPYDVDVRKVVPGDPSPDGKGILEIVRGIEVGHIFQLRTKYSEAMKASFLDESGTPRSFEMGCYGMGITRIVGAAIEQNHDERGIVFPEAIAPFQVALVPIGYGKSAAVREAADALHEDLYALGVEVLLDDRDERPGVMFADAELIGIPRRIVVGERSLKEGLIEYQDRREREPRKLVRAEAIALLRSKLC
ncbi:MAG TPA: proline--tRNA ligase [Burkholderiales bacterium]|nr:proline--tRNA ligase [Burkholderiales bacterium]